jgi:hypothetical protein
MSVIKEGQLKFFSGHTWVQVNARLLSNSVFEYGDKIKTQKLEIGPSVSATPSAKRANYQGVFIINTKEETAIASGPMFAHEEEGTRWMRLINYVRIQNNVKSAHKHPLTLISAIPPKPTVAGPSVLTIASTSPNACSLCKTTLNATKGYGCEFCNKYYQCKDCHEGFKNLESPFIDTPNHNHPLMRIPSARDKRWLYAGKTFACSKCSKECQPYRDFHCVECEGWTECNDCLQASSTSPNTVANEANASMALDLKFLAPAMKVDGHKYALNSIKANQCPQAASIIANRHWDLRDIDAKPAENAYFEVTFNKFNQAGYVSVGIGNQIFHQNQLLGYQQNSFGYVSNGEALQNIGTNSQRLDKYGPGVTIGCGVLLDSYNQRRVYYTKDGQIVGVFEGTLHRGMDCFPGVSFTRSAKPEFVVNFEGPFKFDVTTIPNYRSNQSNRLEALPAEILSVCLANAATSCSVAAQLCQISKTLRDSARSNEVWRPLFLKKWPLQNSKLKIKSWLTMYQRRLKVHRSTTTVPHTQHFIENCDMEFECPLRYENLKKIDASTRHCAKCDKTVYEVSDEDKLREYAQLGRCVTYIEKVEPVLARPVRTMMGSVRRPPEKVPPPPKMEK